MSLDRLCLVHICRYVRGNDTFFRCPTAIIPPFPRRTTKDGQCHQHTNTNNLKNAVKPIRTMDLTSRESLAMDTWKLRRFFLLQVSLCALQWLVFSQLKPR